MKKNIIQISIKGPANSGKSTIARQVQNTLLSYGIGGGLADDDARQVAQRTAALQTQCLEAVATKSEVRIHVEQVSRDQSRQEPIDTKNLTMRQICEMLDGLDDNQLNRLSFAVMRVSRKREANGGERVLKAVDFSERESLRGTPYAIPEMPMTARRLKHMNTFRRGRGLQERTLADYEEYNFKLGYDREGRALQKDEAAQGMYHAGVGKLREALRGGKSDAEIEQEIKAHRASVPSFDDIIARNQATKAMMPRTFTKNEASTRASSLAEIRKLSTDELAKGLEDLPTCGCGRGALYPRHAEYCALLREAVRPGRKLEWPPSSWNAEPTVLFLTGIALGVFILLLLVIFA